MLRSLLLQVIEREGWNDEIICYFNEDNLVETGNGGALQFLLQVTNEDIIDTVIDVLDMEFCICDVDCLNDTMMFITMER